MKKLLRFFLLFTFALVTHQYFWQNLDFTDGLPSILKVAAILTIFEFVIKPVIRIIAFPINLLTLGLFRLVINTLGLYLSAFLVITFTVKDIVKPISTLYGINLPAINITGFFAYLFTSISLSVIIYFFSKILIKKQPKKL